MAKKNSSTAAISIDPFSPEVVCVGDWSLTGILGLDKIINKTTWPKTSHLIVNGMTITTMDTSGAWKLYKLITNLQNKGFNITLQGFSPEHESLLSLIATEAKQLTPIPKPTRDTWLERLGKRSYHELGQITAFLAFIGELALVLLRSFSPSKHIRWRPLLYVIETTGFQALPIIALLSFMIGVVLTYQMGLQLRNYGAEIFIVDLLGGAILREFGGLLTAIMVVGRTGSAFTAQLGTMKLNEEIDALRIMGILPAELLVLPRLVGLVIVMPLLTIWADVFGIFGGMFMSKAMFHISYVDFLTRFQHQVSLRSLLIGIGKAPVFALLIASIGCFQGMQVAGGAESVGKKTTKGVVQAIFVIIVADALFSIIFSKLGI